MKQAFALALRKADMNYIEFSAALETVGVRASRHSVRRWATLSIPTVVPAYALYGAARLAKTTTDALVAEATGQEDYLANLILRQLERAVERAGLQPPLAEDS